MSAARPQTLGAFLLHGAAAWPEREALVFGAERITYAGLLDGSRIAAARLASLGVGSGDKVGLLLWNGPEFLFTLFGAQLLGAVAVPINTRFRRQEIAHAVVRAEVSVLVTGAVDGDPIDYAERTAEALPELASGDPSRLAAVAPQLRAVVSSGREPLPGMIDAAELDGKADPQLAAGAQVGSPDDPALILFTSGTTAWPKGCVLTGRGVLHVWRAVGERFGFRHEDRIFDPLPLFHLGALGPTLAALDLGATLLGMRHFESGAALELIERERATWLYTMFPPVTMGLVEDPTFAARDLSSLRALANVAPPDVLATISRAFAPVPQLQGQYGMTEGSGSMTANRLDDTPEGRIETGGLPLPDTEIKVVDPESGAALGAGVRGELRFRGPGVFRGYHGDPEATAETLDAEGWLHSGDLGTIDARGRVQFIGRRKEMLKVGGENVAPAEIESRIASLPGVKLVQVVPAPDARLDEVPAAFVELLPGHELSAEEVIAHCRGAIAGFKVPRHVRFVSEWPMSATKVQKTKLRDRIAAELGA